MKKLIFIMMLVLTAGLFTSCQKGENFFNGTWQAVGTYWYEDKDGNEFRDVYTVELTLAKKSGEATWTTNYPNKKENNSERKGTYKYYNDNTVSVTFPETKEYEEWVFLVYRSEEDENRLWGGDYEFTKVKNK
ncbi:MAG: hypothetical protein K2I68_02385 [Bacteroidales bacterium]|nr:hypothetical protein [Bacteroidales bacterium]MDE6112317.1 hypothetical protein [Bacteroidales bacterium]